MKPVVEDYEKCGAKVREVRRIVSVGMVSAIPDDKLVRPYGVVQVYSAEHLSVLRGSIFHFHQQTVSFTILFFFYIIFLYEC